MAKKDKEIKREPSGAFFFLLTGLALSAVIAVPLAVAGFFLYAPFLNLASAVLLVPVFYVLLYKSLRKKTRFGAPVARVLTFIVSAAGAYVFICVTTGVLSGVFGAEPVDSEYMRETGIMEYIDSITTVLGNAALYISFPQLLWQDLAAWGSEGWTVIAAAAFFSQVTLPQIFIKKGA
jgi:hypothetical protein